MTTYAKNLPFLALDEHDFVELAAPNPDFPSHYTSRSGRYFKNWDGRVFVPEALVEEMLADGCKLAPGVTLDRPGVDLTPVPAVPNYSLPEVLSAPDVVHALISNVLAQPDPEPAATDQVYATPDPVPADPAS